MSEGLSFLKHQAEGVTSPDDVTEVWCRDVGASEHGLQMAGDLAEGETSMENLLIAFVWDWHFCEMQPSTHGDVRYAAQLDMFVLKNTGFHRENDDHHGMTSENPSNPDQGSSAIPLVWNPPRYLWFPCPNTIEILK